MPVRLIDLHCNWLRQYAPETMTFGPAPAYAEIPDRLKQQSGYMTATSAAILCCERAPADWELQPDPWLSLSDLIARYESEFAGRLLIGPADLDRWGAEPPDDLTWGILGICGFDYLVRDEADLKQLPAVFDRGVRAIQLVETANSRLAGSADPGDERGLTPLGRACLSEILALASPARGPCVPILDLAHLNPRSMSEVIDVIEAAVRSGALLLMYSHGAVAHGGFDTSRAIDATNLERLRSLGGLIGLTPAPPFHRSAEEFKAAIDQVATVPFEGRAGYEGIALGCDFLEIAEPLQHLADASQVVDWVSRSFDVDVASLVLETNARRLLAKAIG
jgi:membrane dipeptidase